MTRTIVIGGTGFLGKYLTKHLLQAGRKVIIVGRRKSCITTQFPAGCQYIAGDYGDINMLHKILTPGCEIINLAYDTVPQRSFDDPLYDLDSNLYSNVKLMHEASKLGVSKILVVSSGGAVYGPADFFPITEKHSTHPISPYGISKLAIENYAFMYYRTKNLPVIVVRPSNAYGEDQRIDTGQGFLAVAMHAILQNKEIPIYGTTGTIRDYIHVSDVATGIIAALERGKDGGIYNIGTGIGTSLLQLMNLLRSIVEKEGYALKLKIFPSRLYDVDINILDSTHLRTTCEWEYKITIQQGLQSMWVSKRDHAQT